MKRLPGASELALWGVVWWAVGFCIAVFSSVGVPEDAMPGLPLGSAGPALATAAGLVTMLAARARPAGWWLWAAAFAVGFIVVVITRVDYHQPSVGAYATAFKLAWMVVPGAFVGAWVGAWSTRYMLARSQGKEDALVRGSRMRRGGLFMAAGAVACFFASMPFANPHDPSTAGYVAAIASLVALFGLLIALIGHLRVKSGAAKPAE